MLNRQFIKAETYHVTSGDGTTALLHPFYNQNEGEDHIISGFIISNMNKHWDSENVVFIRKDGINTYPFKKGNSISVNGRKTRLATKNEKLIMDFAIKINDVPTNSEIRNIKINSVI